MITGKESAEKALPRDHKLGMRVPKGGSSCSTCKFLASPTTCGNEGFIKWNKGPDLPFPKNEYCCDLYQIETRKEQMEPVNFNTDPEKQDSLARKIRKMMTEKLSDEAEKNIKKIPPSPGSKAAKRLAASEVPLPKKGTYKTIPTLHGTKY